MASFSAVCSHLSYKNRYYIQKLEFSHDQDGCGPKTTLSIAESSGTVSRDLLEYSGSGILFSTYFMAATDRKMLLRNLTRTNDFFANWAFKTQLVHLENFHLVYIYIKTIVLHTNGTISNCLQSLFTH